MARYLWMMVGLMSVSMAAAGPTTKEVDRDVDYDVTHNADGSTTITRSATSTNENNGKSASRTDTVNTDKTSDGRTVTRDTEATGPNGGKIDSTTSGEARRNPDGSISSSSHTDGTATGPKGNQRDYSVDRTGHTTKTEDGHSRDVTKTATGENGRQGTIDKGVNVTRDGEGNRERLVRRDVLRGGATSKPSADKPADDTSERGERLRDRLNDAGDTDRPDRGGRAGSGGTRRAGGGARGR